MNPKQASAWVAPKAVAVIQHLLVIGIAITFGSWVAILLINSNIFERALGKLQRKKGE